MITYCSRGSKILHNSFRGTYRHGGCCGFIPLVVWFVPTQFGLQVWNPIVWVFVLFVVRSIIMKMRWKRRRGPSVYMDVEGRLRRIPIKPWKIRLSVIAGTLVFFLLIELVLRIIY